jgi:hypothetical protein
MSPTSNKLCIASQQSRLHTQKSLSTSTENSNLDIAASNSNHPVVRRLLIRIMLFISTYVSCFLFYGSRGSYIEVKAA